MKPSSRVLSIDAWRGAVMIVMALDHTRDFFHTAAMTSSPTDLAKTTPMLFLTRWVTHFCLPVFMFAAGMGAYLWRQQRGRSTGELSRFLWTRGVWFVALELMVMQVAYDFKASLLRYLTLLLILWIFGACMILMALLVYVPIRWLAAGSIAMTTLHNCLDGLAPAQFGRFAWAWDVLHQPGVFRVGGHPVLVTYTVIPWIAVMAAGFCFAQIFSQERAVRQRILWRLGAALTIAFVAIRAVNRYGDPAPWSIQESAVFTVLSFLNTTKYPPSLDFLLMTMGPALMILAWFDGRRWKETNPLIVFGRVPFFYFVLHFYVIHGAAVIAAWLRYGTRAFQFVFNPLPSMGGPAALFPKPFGYSLPVVYAVWIAIVALLYPVCRWYAGVKARRRTWWLSYL